MRVFRQFRYLRPAFGRVKGMFTLAGLATLLHALTVLLPPYLTKLLFDRGVAIGDIGTILLYGLMMIGAVLLSTVFEFAGTILSEITGSRFIMHVRSHALERLLQMRLEFFDKHRSGYLAEQLDQFSHLGEFISPMIFMFAGSLIQAAATLVIMTRISPEITAVGLPFLLLFFLIIRKTNVSLKRTYDNLMENNAQLHGSLQEMISGIAEVKHSAAEAGKSGEAARQFEVIADQQIKGSFFMSLGMQSMQLLVSLVGVIVLILCGIYIVRGELTMGDYVALAGYVAVLFVPVSLLSDFTLTIQPAIVALDRLRSIFEEKTEQEVGGNKCATKLKGAISFDSVTFSYGSGSEPILRNCSFSVLPAECVAILGKNGAGKSTVLKLLLGFYPQYDGRIYIDGSELHDYDMISIRKRVGIVSQNVVLFNGSLWDNVKMVNPAASKEEVERALALSGCKDVFDGDLSEVQVTEAGKNLSGGQKQAVAIARCLLKDPDILIFDEATANLDAAATHVVMHALKREFAQKTRILITHDAAIAKIADTLFTLEEGVIKRIKTLGGTA